MAGDTIPMESHPPLTLLLQREDSTAPTFLKTGQPCHPGRMLTVEDTLLDSHSTSQMLPGDKATSGPGGFPSPPGVLQE